MRAKRIFLGYDIKNKRYTSTDRYDQAFDDNGTVHADYEHNIDQLMGVAEVLKEQKFDVKSCAVCKRPFYCARHVEVKCYNCRDHSDT